MRQRYLITLLLLSSGLLRAQAHMPMDTIRFGDYYLDRGGANMPLVVAYEKNTNTQIDKLPNKEWIDIEISGGLFDRYEAHAIVLSHNGKVKKINHHQFSIYAEGKNEKYLLELNITYDLHGDSIYYQIRDWTDQAKTNYTEKIQVVKTWESTIWLGIK